MRSSADRDPRGGRQSRVRASLLQHELDALLVTHLPNIRYLTGFSGTAALLLVHATGLTLISDFRYESQAAQDVGGAAEVIIDRSNVWDRLGRVLHDRGIQRLGIEGAHLAVSDAARCSALGRFQVVPVIDVVEALRAQKSADEVAAIGEAIAIAQGAFAAVLPTIHSGESELAVASRLESELRIRGSEWHPFPTIAASGPRSALPHARTSDRTIEPGDWLLLDFGAQARGYCADLTRTVVVGRRAEQRQRDVYEIVRAAQSRAIAGIRVGLSGREVDSLARQPIMEQGFGDAFGHSLGHGLGLEVHEQPRLAPTSDTVLSVGVVVTIEPGIYLPGWGGVRIEDDLHLGSEGPKCLSDQRTDLLELV